MCTVQLYVSTCYFICWLVLVTKAAQLEMRSERVGESLWLAPYGEGEDLIFFHAHLDIHGESNAAARR